MTIETRAGNEAQIRERIEGWAKALRAKDSTRSCLLHARRLVVRLAPPLFQTGDASDEAGKSGSRRSAARSVTRSAT